MARTENSAVSLLLFRQERNAIIPPQPKPEIVQLKDEDLEDDMDDLPDVTEDIMEIVTVPPTFESEWAIACALDAEDRQHDPVVYRPITIASMRRLIMLAATNSDRVTACLMLSGVLDYTFGLLDADPNDAGWFNDQPAKVRQQLDQSLNYLRRALACLGPVTGDPDDEATRLRLVEQLVRHLKVRNDPEAATAEALLRTLQQR
jgi:hypothetical protein